MYNVLNEFFHFFLHPKRTPYVLFLPRTACRRDTPWTSPTRTKLAENLWNTFEHLRATWISVESRSLLVTRHEPSTFPKIGIKNANNFWNCSGSRKKFEDEKISLRSKSKLSRSSMEMKSKIYKRWDSILGDLLAICSTEITTKFRKNWKNGQKSADHRRVHGP